LAMPTSLRAVWEYVIMTIRSGWPKLAVIAMKPYAKGLRAGSLGIMLLALLLAVSSGDLLLVVAVGCAIGGVVVLSGQHGSVGPIDLNATAKQRPSGPRTGSRAPGTALRSARQPMAVRLPASDPLVVPGGHRRSAGAPEPLGADASNESDVARAS